MTRILAGVAVVLALLLGNASTAAAQDDPSAPASPEPTVVETSPSPTSSAEPSASTEPSTTSSAPSTTASSAPAAPQPSSSTTAAPSTTRTPASTSHAPRPSGTAAGAAAEPGATSTPPTTSSSSPRYSALVPWLPPVDRPWIGLLAVGLMIVGGVGFAIVLERPRRRGATSGRNARLVRYDLTG